MALASFRQLDASSPSILQDIEVILEEKVEEILSTFSSNDPLPLVRLIVDISGFPAISHKVFGAKFIGKIANPDSLLLLKKKRIYTTNDSGQEVIEENSELSHMAQFDYMATMIEKSLKEMGNMELLSNQHMREACKSLSHSFIPSITVRQQRMQFLLAFHGNSL